MPNIQVKDVVESGVSKLLHQFQDKVNIVSLLSAYLSPIQDAEDLSQDVLLSRAISLATGRALDQIGSYVGESRQLRLDDAYREAIRLRIITNNSNATPNDVIQAAQLLIPYPITYQEIYPAKISIEVDTNIIDTTAYARLKRATAAGVDLEITYPAQTLGDTYIAAFSELSLIIETSSAGPL